MDTSLPKETVGGGLFGLIRDFAIDNYDKPLHDEIQILIYKEVQKLIRLNKIIKMLDDSI